MSNISPRKSSWEHSLSSDKTKQAENGTDGLKIKRNGPKRKEEIESSTKGDVKVEIPDKIKEFSRIKSAVIRVPDVDHREKIANLKRQIQEGVYDINYEKLAEKILISEF